MEELLWQQTHLPSDCLRRRREEEDKNKSELWCKHKRDEQIKHELNKKKTEKILKKGFMLS